jgi:acetylornithine deacetylase/succinyl-diaminopimelate desuccinylase-like protein
MKLICALLVFSLNAFAVSKVDADDIKLVVTALASEPMQGRAPKTEGSKRARGFIVDWLEKRRIEPLGDNGTYFQEFPRGTNVLGLIPGRDGKDRDPVLLISAHYDHLGVNCPKQSGNPNKYCPGAADDAGGVAVVLAAANALRGKTERPIAIALWDSEEIGPSGSAYFSNKPTFKLDSLRLIINMDIVGLNLFKGLESNHFALGAESGGPSLVDAIHETASKGIELNQLSYAFGHRRSDITSFVSAGWKIPFVLFSDGDGGVYHTTGDDLLHLNQGKVQAVAESVTALAERATAEVKRPYVYQELAQIQGNYVPRFSDVAPVGQLLRKTSAVADANPLDAADRSALLNRISQIDAVAKAGPTKFDGAAMQGLGVTSRWFFKLSAKLPATAE